MDAGAIFHGLPTHKRSYQLGVLATPVQIRTDPFLLHAFQSIISRFFRAALREAASDQASTASILA